MAEEGKNVRLVSVEGESYEIPVEVAKMSDLVKNMIDDVSRHNSLQNYYSFSPLSIICHMPCMVYVWSF